MDYIQLVETESSFTSVTPTTSAILAMSKDTDKVKIMSPVEAVDLGLPSGTKWMTKNIGAESESDYGKYFQWGDTIGYEGDEAKTHSTWSTCPFNNGSGSYDEAYFASVSSTVCPNGELALEYDAAYQATNGQAKMPTDTQFSELTEKTNSAWVTINGVSGCQFTNRSDSSKYIFIPAAGKTYNGVYGQGSFIYIWSSTLDGNEWASTLWGEFVIYDEDDMVLEVYTDVGERISGLTIRGVLV